MEFKPRTQKEIAEYHKEKGKTFMWFSSVEFDYMTWKGIIENNLQDGVKEEFRGKNWVQEPYTKENIIAKMRDYVGFAVEKWDDDRGLSIQRSNAHFHTWCWLLGEDYFDKYVTNGDKNLPAFYNQFTDIE